MPDPILVGGALLAYAWSGPGEGDAYPETATAYEVDEAMPRGRVLPLSLSQIVNRARYLAGELTIDGLDPYVRAVGAPRGCPTIYYRLKDHNGGKDPSAPDPATRWKSSATSTTTFVTSDCMGGAAWCGGFDRYQAARFAHIYGGWINTDSMLADARGPAKCFRILERPIAGCMVVAATYEDSSGKKVTGHVGTVVDGIDDWIDTAAGWRALGVVDVAGRSGRANRRSSTGAAGWYSRPDRAFVISKMQP